MRLYFMTIAALLILVEKTPGGLLRFYDNTNKVPWKPCEIYQGTCRTSCGKAEVQYLTCPQDQKCCLRLPTKRTYSKSRKKENKPSSSLPLTNTSSHSRV